MSNTEFLDQVRSSYKRGRNSTSTLRVTFLELLALLFIGLKLTNVIAWSWWWVLAPLWIPFALVIAVFLVALVILLFVEARR